MFYTNSACCVILFNMPQDVKKTTKMKSLEKKFKRDLEVIIPELVNEYGLSGAAKKLGLGESGKSTLSYWMLKLGIQFRKVALAPGEIIEIRRISD
ncbi:MAG: hypothetical protein CL706_03905 [Chloroflexi bacterium]|nr:hypothetical protein [Chloroflexota bacterium]MBP06108.1 hypothetical protein [Chloroflexota bacterium]OUW95672.1 MAG: hypothetical protein CBD90_02620 [Chloroflexi bacterium TMED230]